MTEKSIIGNAKSNEFKIEVTSPEELLAKYGTPKEEPKGSSKVRKSRKEEPIVQPIESPLILPTGDLIFVNDKSFYNEVSKYIEKEHPNLENTLTFDEEEVMHQSNPRLAVAVDMFCKKYFPEYRIANQINLEANIPMFEGFYVDTGLALKSLIGANKEQAEYLFQQLEKRGVKLTHFPIWLNLRGLELDKNINFNLTEESSYKTAQCLNWKNGTKYSKIDDFGLPKEKDASSSRKIWTAKDYALSSCYLSEYSNLNSKNPDFADSYDAGRVVLAKIRSTI